MSTLSVGTIQSNTTSPPTINNSAGTAIGTFCRAWVNFNGTSATSPFTIANGGIRAAFNVSSVTDNGSGDYTINFTTAMSDANYALVGTAIPTSTTERMVTSAAAFSQLTTSIRFGTRGGGGSLNDVENVYVAIFR